MSIKNTLLCFLISLSAFAQKPLNFAEMLTYEYVQDGKKKEFSVYLDRKSSTWLFTNADSFDGTADGIEFVVAYPNGKYLVCGIDDVNQKFCQTFDSPLARKNTVKISGKALGKSLEPTMRLFIAECMFYLCKTCYFWGLRTSNHEKGYFFHARYRHLRDHCPPH